MIYRLIFLSGPRTGERITITEEPMVVGRDADCAVTVPDLEVARKHATLQQKDDELFIRDMGSMNRILVNKRELREGRLKHGDEIELGRTRLVVQALVQAEVEGVGAAHRRRYRAAWAVAAMLFIGIVLVLSARYVPHGTDSDVAGGPAVAPAPAARAPDSPAPPSNVTQDLRVLRDDIMAIQQSVKDLAAQPAAARSTGSGLPILAPPASPRTPREEAEELLAAAREAAAAKHPDEADQLLAHIQAMDPDFLPAYEERARLFEAQGRRGDAAAQWSAILHRSLESPLYQKAVAERIRLGHAAAPQPAPDQQVLRISGLQQSRFRAGDDFDEMRVLNISLAPMAPGAALDREAVRVEVTFFDRDPEGRDIAPSEARVTQQEVPPTAAWGRESERVVSATYMVPRGLRERQREEGRARAFHGYTVRVFYHDRLQDEAAAPTTLLARPGGVSPAATEAHATIAPAP